MAKEGWTYVSVKIPDLHPEFVDDKAEEAARIKRVGLGITYYLLANTAQDDGAGDGWGNYDDKNNSYIDGLGAAERTAYDASLYGTEEEQEADKTTTVDPVTGEQLTIDLHSVGCRGEAKGGFYGDDPAHNPVYTQLMQSYWDNLDARTAADPRFVAANAEWSACMKKAGYDYDTPATFTDSAYFDFQTRSEGRCGP